MTGATARDIAEAVAPFLTKLTGDTWAPDHRYDHDARLVRNGSDVALYFNTGSTWAPKDKVAVSGSIPSGAEYSQGDTRDWQSGEINVGIARGAETIAKEIVRRCLPVYLASHAEASERIANRISRENAAEALARRFADIMGTTAWERSREWRAPVPNCLGFYGDIRPNYDGTEAYVELLGVPVDLAIRIAELVREQS